jgi:hypothetical protein
LLRDGAFSGLRDNIRAIGDYAGQQIGKDAAKAQVAGLFKELDTLDGMLFQVNFSNVIKMCKTSICGMFECCFHPWLPSARRRAVFMHHSI